MKEKLGVYFLIIKSNRIPNNSMKSKRKELMVAEVLQGIALMLVLGWVTTCFKMRVEVNLCPRGPTFLALLSL